MKRLWLAAYRLRIVFRGIFLLLAIATVALALSLLQQEKQLALDAYQTHFDKTQQQLSALLRHPSGQLALLNPGMLNEASTGLHPVILPFAALDFDDQSKVQQAIAMSGCLQQYGENGDLCAGIGNSPWGGAFLYLAGHFNAPALTEHERGERDLSKADRLELTLNVDDQDFHWIAPFEADASKNNAAPVLRGRFTGFLVSDLEAGKSKPYKDFRALVWQQGRCNQPPANGDESQCQRTAFFSVRIAIPQWQAAIYTNRNPAWPPTDLNRLRIHAQIKAANSEQVLLDSDHENRSGIFSLRDLQQHLLAGEKIEIRRLDQQKSYLQLQGDSAQALDQKALLIRLINWLPVEKRIWRLERKEVLNTAAFPVEFSLTGDQRSALQNLTIVAARISWYVAAMLLALLLAWGLLEVNIMRRITLLSKRAKALSSHVKASQGIDQFNLNDLRSADELGVLASCLQDLLRRVREDLEREQIRAAQEKDMWHAVGHEIMSPLQSLLALHQREDDPSLRYLQRMQQALTILYGNASPSEAFQASVLDIAPLELQQFVSTLIEYAPDAGIADLIWTDPRPAAEQNIWIKADAHSLEDVFSHILNNALRYRLPDTAIEIGLQADERYAVIRIQNRGPQIPEEMIDKIFEYGVSDQAEAGAMGQRGQGLFVAKTYMAKMGGTISVSNLDDGVCFVLTLPRAAAPL